jgi:hypothetical protein
MSILLAMLALIIGAGQIDPNAMALLARMSETLSTSRSLVVTARVEREQIDARNHILNFYTTTQAALLRPNRLYTATAGDLHPFGTWYDGAVLTVYEPDRKMYGQVMLSESTDALLQTLAQRFSTTSPLAPFLASNPYAQFSRGVQSARIIADVRTGDSLCRQIALTGADVDRQIWITIDDDLTLPARMAVVFKKVPGRPRMVVEFARWDLDVSLVPSTFRFRPPEGATESSFVL